MKKKQRIERETKKKHSKIRILKKGVWGDKRGEASAIAGKGILSQTKHKQAEIEAKQPEQKASVR